VLAYYADLLEAYYDLMDQRVGIDPSPSLKKTKMKVSVYKSRPEFTELTKADPGVAGFFSRARASCTSITTTRTRPSPTGSRCTRARTS
jgi:hypothetical protein